MTSCQDCMYFSEIEGHDANKGTCHFHAPKPTVAGLNTVRWPEVKPTDWCGDFISKHEDLGDDEDL